MIKVALKKKEREGLKNAISLSLIQKITKGGNRQLQLGHFMLSKENLDLAELCFDKAVEETENKKIKVKALIGKAHIFQKRKAFEEAYQALSKANNMLVDEDLPDLLGLVYQKEGEVGFEEGRFNKAIDAYKKAKHAFSSAGNTSGQAKVSLQIGVCAQQILNFKLAFENYKQAVDMLDEDSSLLIYAQVGKTEALAGLGKTKEADKQCQVAEELAYQKEDKGKLLPIVIQRKASNNLLLGDFSKASHLYAKALKNSSGLRQKGEICSLLAKLYFSMGHPDKAKAYEQQAQTLCDIAGEVIPEVYFNLSQLNLMRGKVKTSEKQFFQAQNELPSSLSKGQEMSIKSSEIRLDMTKGELNRAIENAEYLYEELSDMVKPLFISLLNTLGDIATIKGDQQKAKDYYQQALRRVTELEYPLTKAHALAGLAEVEATKFNPSEALSYLDEAIALTQDCQAKVYEHSLQIRRITILNQENDNPEESAYFLEELLHKGRKFKSLFLDVVAKMHLGIVYWQELSDYDKASTYLYEVLESAEKTGLQLIAILSKGLLGSVLDDQGEKEVAESYLEDALMEMEERELEIESKWEFAERYRHLTGWFFE